MSDCKSTGLDASFLIEVESFFYFEDRFTDQLTEWAQRKCRTFISRDPRQQEQPLHHSTIHVEFCDLFESILSDFLTQNSVTVNDFYNLLRREQSLAESGRSGGLPVSATFGNMLMTVTNFFNFCEMMYEVRAGSDVIFCPPLILVEEDEEQEQLQQKAQRKDGRVAGAGGDSFHKTTNYFDKVSSRHK